MKKLFVLAIASASIIACNDDTQTKSINEDTRDNSTVTETPAPATTTTVYTPADGDVTYRDHKVLVMRNGAWVETEKDVTLDNGVVVYKNGKVVKDNDEIELKDGEVVNKEGNFFDKTGQAIENAWKDTKSGVKKAGNEVKDAVDGDHHDDDKK